MPKTREAPIPSANGFGTADSVAKLYGVVANGGMYKVTLAMTPSIHVSVYS